MAKCFTGGKGLITPHLHPLCSDKKATKKKDFKSIQCSKDSSSGAAVRSSYAKTKKIVHN